MAHPRVNILQYVRTGARWNWKPIPKRNGAYLWAQAEGSRFYMVWREADRKRCEKAGDTPAEALEAKRRKEFELAGRAVLERGRRIVKARENGFTVDAAAKDFLEFIKNKRRPNTLKRYRAVLAHFRKFFRAHTAVSQVTPADIDAFRDERLHSENPWGERITPRNVNYEVATIRAFYYYLQKFRDPNLPNPAAKLRPLAVTRTIVESYEEPELEAFFKACSLEERAVFKTFYYTGLRDQELAHLHWTDLNLSKGMLIVRAKPEEGFIPKDWEEREIPLHPELIALFRALPRKHPVLVFPSFRGQPNGHLLRMLKTVQDRAKLPGRWYLHKFRKTFATRALERGADIRTVQALLGHKNITTTARYLSTSTDKMREAVKKL
jgi:integrase